MFLDHQIDIIKWFLKNHETGLMAGVAVMGLNYILKCIQIEMLF